ncbi:major facilitator superfamily domain-containing protein [Kalaharituber pfeilii]|nr:major facilitator superfamily domain-containing protein [Kalaharituber pfeilii]
MDDELAQFEVRWENGDADPYSPRSMSKGRKWLVTLVVSLSSTCVTCTSSIYTATYANIEHEFPGTSRLLSISGLSLFILGLGIGPMLLGPLSEFYGRRPIYLCSFTFFLIFLIPCAVARNMATLLVGRFLNGFAGSAFLSVAGGTVGDMFSGGDLGAPMMIYTASPFIGPVIGPLIGGYINQHTSWRWTYYVLLIWSGVMLASLYLWVPETYHPIVLRMKALALRSSTGDSRYWAPVERSTKSIAKTVALSCLRPWQLLWFEPMVLFLCLLTSVLLGILYLFFQAFPLVFSSVHHMDLQSIGLTFLGLFVGVVIGILTDPLWRQIYFHLVSRNHPRPSQPEYRLPPAILGSILVPMGMFWFGFTTYPSIHWIVPIMGSVLFGAGTLLCFSGVFTFLVDAYPLYAASALAANSLTRSAFAAGFPLFGVKLYDRLGLQWATAVLAFLAVGLAPFPWIFFRWGRRIRGRSRFARVTD